MTPESFSERLGIAQKLVSVKQHVAQAITDEFLSIPSGQFVTGNVAASSARQMRAFIWTFSPELSRPGRRRRLPTIRDGRLECLVHVG
jgi:hypothetical protein